MKRGEQAHSIFGLPRRHGETRGDSGDHHRNWKYLVPPQQKRRQAKRCRRDSGNRGNRLMIRGEIERDSRAECDGHPRQQPAGAGLGANPRPQFLDERRPCTET
jgi:hypothetical protein